MNCKCKYGKYCDNVYVHARMHVVVVRHREPTRGEDNIRGVLTRFVFFGCCSFSVYPGRRVYWNMNTVGIQNQSVFYINYNHFTA